MGRGPLRTRASWLVAAIVAAGPFSLSGAGAEVRPGLDRLQSGDASTESLRGRRIGLVTNHTGRAADGTSTLEVLKGELRLDVVALFSPEHGFTGSVAAGDVIESSTLGSIPVHSLYGDTRKPTTAMLEGVDVLVFDIQDIGTRFYTYISTLKLVVDAAAEAGVGVVVLDRPNPLGGLRVEGPVLDPAFASFVGIAPIPLVHGMTTGELARYFARELPGPDTVELEVVRVSGLVREASWGDTGLGWLAPSPNIRTPSAALAYPALGLLEGVQVSEGRGIAETFERFGAPWIDAEVFASALNALELPGVRFEPTEFTPRVTAAAPRPKYADELCRGAELVVTDAPGFEAVRTGLHVIATIRELYPERFEWVESRGGGYWIDQLLGTDRLRLGIDAGVSVDTLLERERAELERFRERTSPLLLYE